VPSEVHKTSRSLETQGRLTLSATRSQSKMVPPPGIRPSRRREEIVAAVYCYRAESAAANRPSPQSLGACRVSE
jgi:hypothetical protein